MVDVLVKAGADVNQAMTKVCQWCLKRYCFQCKITFICIPVETHIHIVCNSVDGSMVGASYLARQNS